MRYLDLPTHKRYSVIGLGTWQFGSREWGYGREYDEHPAETSELLQEFVAEGQREVGLPTSA